MKINKKLNLNFIFGYMNIFKIMRIQRFEQNK